jgi:hypothetical protein
MNHRIKLTSFSIAIVIGSLLTGCGESQAEKQAKETERKRIEAEQQAARDLQKSNQAVTDIGKKLGRKVEPLDIGTTQTTNQNSTPPPAPKQ